MFAKAMPALLETVEDSGKVTETIKKGCLDSGRVRALEEDFGKGMSFIIQIGSMEGADPAQAELKDTHGENWHSDADKTVVDYLTTVEKVDLKNSPIHNPYVTPGPQSGFPQTTKSAPAGVDEAKFKRCKNKVKASGSAVNEYAVCTASLKKGDVGAALDALAKSYPTASAQPPKPPKATMAPVASTPKKPKDTFKEAEDMVRKQRTATVLGAFAKKSACGMSTRAAGMTLPGVKKKRTIKSMDRESLMARGLGWDGEVQWA